MSGWLDKLKDLGVEVHVRSSFLQGLLLISRDKVPKKFRTWDNLWNEWHKWIKENDVSPVEGCLAYVLSHKKIDKVVGLYLVGGRYQQENNTDQLKEEAKIFFKYDHLFGQNFKRFEPYFGQFMR